MRLKPGLGTIHVRTRTLALLMALAALTVSACTAGATPVPATPSPGSTASPVCEALDGLSASVDAVKEVNPLTDGVEGYTQALQAIGDSLRDLRTVAGDQLSQQIDALEQAASDLQTALDNVGSGGIGNSLTEIGNAVAGIGTALVDLRTTAATEFTECQ